MHKLLLIFSLLVCSNLFADTAQIEAGRKIAADGNEQGAPACMTCHMQNGEGMQEEGFPHLAGMSESYIVKQLKDFQGKNRVTDVMGSLVQELKDEDMKSVAAYYASLPVISKPEKSTSQVKFEQGRLIAERGLWNKNVPACFSCHGPNAVGVGESFPPLINQGKIYLTKELQAWKTGTRKNDPGMLMKTIALKLTPKEIEAVVEYISSLSSTQTAGVK